MACPTPNIVVTISRPASIDSPGPTNSGRRPPRRARPRPARPGGPRCRPAGSARGRPGARAGPGCSRNGRAGSPDGRAPRPSRDRPGADDHAGRFPSRKKTASMRSRSASVTGPCRPIALASVSGEPAPGVDRPATGHLLDRHVRTRPRRASLPANASAAKDSASSSRLASSRSVKIVVNFGLPFARPVGPLVVRDLSALIGRTDCPLWGPPESKGMIGDDTTLSITGRISRCPGPLIARSSAVRLELRGVHHNGMAAARLRDGCPEYRTQSSCVPVDAGPSHRRPALPWSWPEGARVLLAVLAIVAAIGLAAARPGSRSRRRPARPRMRSWCSTRTRPPRRPCQRCLTWARRSPDGSPRRGPTGRSARWRMSRPACAGSDRRHWPRYRPICGSMRAGDPAGHSLRGRSRSPMPVPAARTGGTAVPEAARVEDAEARKPRRLHSPRRPTPRRHRDPVASTGRPRLKPRPPITWRRLEPWPKNAPQTPAKGTHRRPPNDEPRPLFPRGFYDQRAIEGVMWSGRQRGPACPPTRARSRRPRRWSMRRSAGRIPPSESGWPRQALEICPDCADAYVILAEHADDRPGDTGVLSTGRRRRRAGAGSGEVPARRSDISGASSRPRPYMRAREGLAHALGRPAVPTRRSATYARCSGSTPATTRGSAIPWSPGS